MPRARAAACEPAAGEHGESLSELVRRAAPVEAEWVQAERTSYIVDDAAVARVDDGRGRPDPEVGRGLQRLVEQPSVLPRE